MIHCLGFGRLVVCRLFRTFACRTHLATSLPACKSIWIGNKNVQFINFCVVVPRDDVLFSVYVGCCYHCCCQFPLMSTMLSWRKTNKFFVWHSSLQILGQYNCVQIMISIVKANRGRSNDGHLVILWPSAI